MGVRYPTDLCQNISSPHAIVLRSSRCKLKTEREESQNLFKQIRWSRNLNMTKIVICALFSFYKKVRGIKWVLFSKVPRLKRFFLQLKQNCVTYRFNSSSSCQPHLSDQGSFFEGVLHNLKTYTTFKGERGKKLVVHNRKSAHKKANRIGL